MNPLIAVLIPTRGLIFTKAVIALDRELAPYSHARFYTTDLPIPDCRNALLDAVEASGIEFTHYLLLDDDVILPEGGLKAMLEADKPCTLIDYPTHWEGKGAKTGITVYDNWKEGESVTDKPVLWSGLGCCLVKSEIFKQLEKPYFRRGGQMFDRDKNGKIILYGISGGDGGEDYEFFYDLREKGIEITMLHGFVAGHAKVMKHIGVITPGKYISCHDIKISNEIERPMK